MQAVSQSPPVAAPEDLPKRVRARLRDHVLWDALLLSVPPFATCLYGAIYLYRSNWLDLLGLAATATIAIAALAVAVFFRIRPRVPSLYTAARRIDQIADAQDRFLTLTTIEPRGTSAELLNRLRREAANLQPRVALQRDFSYRIKRSFYASLALSVIAACLFHLWPVAYSALRATSPSERLRELAEKMAERPNLKALAMHLNALVPQLSDPQIMPERKQRLIQEARQDVAREQERIQQQQNNPQQKQDRDLLNDAAATLKSLEQQAGSGQEQKQDQSAGGGSIESNLPQDGKGENKPTSGGDGQGKGEVNAQQSNEMQGGKSAEGDAKGDSGTKPQTPKDSKGEAKGNEPDSNQPGGKTSQQNSAKAPQGAEEKSGKNQKADDKADGAPPAARYSEGGEGTGVLKNPRYVTVQLPEELATDEKGESTSTKQSKSNRVGAKLPASNAPLPAHVPDAPMEKQRMPLEYRGIIR